MRLVFACTRVLACCVAMAAAAQTGTPAPSRPEVLPNGFIRQAYSQQLQPPTNGVRPWHWRLLRAAPPPGITLDGNGTLAGAPTAAGEYRFTVEAADSAPKALVETRDYLITVPPPLTVAWTQPPRFTADGSIAGELQVTNGTGRTVDLTVIVVAVNTVNKAFALGYQRCSFAVGEQRVYFGSALPRDTYVVHADAIAEVPDTHEIYRARLQTEPRSVP